MVSRFMTPHELLRGCKRLAGPCCMHNEGGSNFYSEDRSSRFLLNVSNHMRVL